MLKCIVSPRGIVPLLIIMLFIQGQVLARAAQDSPAASGSQGRLLAGPSAPQVPVPSWLVPVVRVLADERVMLSTGVYLGEERVLVTSELTAGEVDLRVLDGGADLAVHGRVASLEQRFNLQGLAILRVPGLQRSIPVLSLLVADRESIVELLAMPPPSLVASRPALVRRKSTLFVPADPAATSPVLLQDQYPLPNLTGALIDACGYWVGYSAARGAASMATGVNTQYRWPDELAQLLDGAGLAPERSMCDRSWPQEVVTAAGADTVVAPVPVTGSEPAPVPRPEPEPEPEPEPGPAFTSEEASGAEPENEPPAEAAGAVAQPGDASPAPASLVKDKGWFYPLLALLLAGGIGAVFWLRRRRGSKTVRDSGTGAQPPELDLPLIHLHDAAKPRAAPVAILVRDSPVSTTQDSRGTRVKHDDREEVHAIWALDGRVNLTLGRFESDLLLSSTSASRRHARIHGAVDELMLEDLGSSNGTWVNGQRCSPGRSVPLSIGDELLFGNARYRLLPDDDEGSA